jgi:hypothetical protein
LGGVGVGGGLGARHLNTRVVEREIYDGPSGIDEGLGGKVKEVGTRVKSKL